MAQSRRTCGSGGRTRPHAELVAAATAANAHGFIDALPDGYQTVIGERGTQLSGGQRQRLAIARALLRDSPILVLDEALSSVDTENEAIIQQALDRLMTGRTTLILAHRLSSVIGADRILVLSDGAVVQSGRHRELIQQDGPYRDLMGPQLGEREGVAAPLLAAETAEPDAPAAGAVVGSLSEDAAQVTWPDDDPHPAARGAAVSRPIGGHGADRDRPRGRVHRRQRAGGAGAGGGSQRLADRGAGCGAADHCAARRAAALAGIVDRTCHGLCAAGRYADRSVPQAGRTGAGLSAAAAIGRPGGAGDAGCRNRRILSLPIRSRRRSSRCWCRSV